MILLHFTFVFIVIGENVIRHGFGGMVRERSGWRSDGLDCRFWFEFRYGNRNGLGGGGGRCAL